ncbi:hypothetical protein D3C74_451550 [compost metagenome]
MKQGMKQIHWTLIAGMLLSLGAIVIRRTGLEIGDFTSGMLSGLTIVLIINGIIHFAKNRAVVK